MSVTAVAVLLTAITLLAGQPIFRALFGAVEPAVHEAGMEYLRITACSFVPLAVTTPCAGLYRSMGKTRELLYVSIAMNAINVAGKRHRRLRPPCRGSPASPIRRSFPAYLRRW